MKMAGNESAKNKYRVCLIGAGIDYGNMGVRALACSLIKLALEGQPDAIVQLLYSNRTGGFRDIRMKSRTAQVEVLNFRLSPKSRFNEHLLGILCKTLLYRFVPLPPLRRWLRRTNRWIDSLLQADFIGDVCGGDSFSDIYGLRRLIVSEFPCFIALLLGKPLVMLPQTYGPFSGGPARFVARYIFKRAARIYARDLTSLEVVKKLLGKRAASKSINFCPDVAFALEAIPPAQTKIKPSLDDAASAPEALIGLNVSGLLHMGGYTRDNMFGLRFDYREFIARLLERLINETDAHMLLVPHTFGASAENDQAACREVWLKASERHGERIHLLEGEYDQNEVKAVIGQCSFFLGSRMHSCIAGLSQGVPSVGLAYSRKFLGVFESIGVSEMALDLRQLELEETLDSCLQLFAERDRVTALLREKIPEAKERLRQFVQREFGATSSASSSAASFGARERA
jgi:colanic acid/amylovoran biosynthesis protein